LSSSSSFSTSDSTVLIEGFVTCCQHSVRKYPLGLVARSCWKYSTSGCGGNNGGVFSGEDDDKDDEDTNTADQFFES